MSLNDEDATIMPRPFSGLFVFGLKTLIFDDFGYPEEHGLLYQT